MPDQIVKVDVERDKKLHDILMKFLKNYVEAQPLECPHCHNQIRLKVPDEPVEPR